MDAARPEAVVGVYRTAAARLVGVGPVVEDPADVLRRFGVRDGQRFVLGADGSYDVELNRFFRELGGWGVRSDNGAAAYISM